MDAGEIQATHTKRANRPESLERTEQTCGRGMGGRLTEQFQGCRARILGADQQVFEAAPLRCVRQGRQLPPEAFGNSITHARDQTRQRGHAWKKDLALNQAGGGEIEEHARCLRADPGPSIEPAKQAVILPRLVEVLVAIDALNLPCVLPRGGIPLAVEQQARGIGDAELRCDTEDYDGWDVSRVRQKRPQIAHRAQLYSKTKSVVRATPLAYER